MNDAFYEHFVSRKPRIKDYLLQVLMIVGIIIVSYILAAFIGSLGLTLGLVGIFLVIYLVFPRFKVEYEYSLLNHYLEISAIYNKEGRKKKADMDIQKAEIIAPTGSPRVGHYKATKKLDFSSGRKDAKTFSIFSTSSDQKLCEIIIEPDETMIHHMKGWMGSKMYLD